MRGPLPNAFLVGMPKAGTTALAAALAAHPDCRVSHPKEPGFFARDLPRRRIDTWTAYRALWEGAQEAVRLDASTTYLRSLEAVPAIEAVYPGARYVAVLREPAAVVEAMHAELLRSGIEHHRDLGRAWRRAGGSPWCDYRAWGAVGSQVARLLATVPGERVLLLRYEHWRERPRETLDAVQQFLGLAPRVLPVPRANPRAYPRWLWLARAAEKLRPWAWRTANVLGCHAAVDGAAWLLQRLERRQRPVWPATLRQAIREHFVEEVRLLERLTGWDLAAWREPLPRQEAT